jgi:hypothetical protein
MALAHSSHRSTRRVGAISIIPGIGGMSMRRLVGLLFVLSTLTFSCSSSSSLTSSSGTSQGQTASVSTSSINCPVPERGGSCLGELMAGTYTTTSFMPSITYTAPDGWANWEDLPGFLLLPPGESLEGVDADTSDFIGIYHGVAAAAKDCKEKPETGVGRSAKTLAAWFISHAGLKTTEPQPVEVGGLKGLMLDLTLVPNWTGTCPFAPGEPLVPLIIGIDAAAGVHHVIKTRYATRLYLLDTGDSNIVIEIVDHEGGADVADYTSVVDTILFGPS